MPLNDPVSAPLGAAEREGPGVGTVVADDLPDEVLALVDVRRHEQRATFAAERGHGVASCASVHNQNPLFWRDEVADELAGGPVLPPSTLSLWSRPHSWDPEAGGGPMPLQTHFDLKDLLDLPDAVVTRSAMRFDEPVRPGDVMTTAQTLRSVSAEKGTTLGVGRFWVIDVDYANQRGEPVGTESITGFGYRRVGPRPRVSDPRAADDAAIDPPPGAGDRPGPPGAARDGRLLLADVVPGERLPELVHRVTTSTVVLGAMAARDWQPMHHDRRYARDRSGVDDIFLDTPTQVAWFERHVTDWTGSTGRLGRLDLRMGRPVLAGDTMVLSARVGSVAVDDLGCGWVVVDAAMAVGDEVRSRAVVRIALPAGAGDNPWTRRGPDWRP